MRKSNPRVNAAVMAACLALILGGCAHQRGATSAKGTSHLLPVSTREAKQNINANPIVEIAISSNLARFVHVERVTPDLIWTTKVNNREIITSYNLKSHIGEFMVAGIEDLADENDGIVIVESASSKGKSKVFVNLSIDSCRADYGTTSEYNDVFEVDIRFRVTCRDAQGAALRSFYVNGHCREKQSDLSVLAGELLQLASLNMTGRFEIQNLYSRAMKKAATDGLSKIFSRLSKRDWAKDILTADMDGRSVMDMTNRGISFYEKRDYYRASLYLQKALNKDSRYQPAACYQGVCLAYMGKTHLAIQTLHETINMSPETIEADQARKWLRKISDPTNLAMAPTTVKTSRKTWTKKQVDERLPSLINARRRILRYQARTTSRTEGPVDLQALRIEAIGKDCEVILLPSVQWQSKPGFTGYVITVQCIGTKSGNLLCEMTELAPTESPMKGNIKASFDQSLERLAGRIGDKFI